ncbi:MAG: hypothetical protein J0H09_10620 [Burkholderiales bacterium]|nr:hypothetical protein [Burkholderiales bacterium]ODU69799.1 MAG: hypothetical protein ABT05_01975 [Lautropia sp. SCN 66-9]
MSAQLDDFRRALTPTREGLEAAGFDFEVSEVEGRMKLKVIAGAGACEDCLVPKSLFRDMAVAEIREAGLPERDFDIVYPVDGRRS